MARRAAPPQPQSANLTVDQMRRGIDRLKLRIADLEAFELRSVEQRWGPEVKALQTSIEETLAAVFGHNTVEYNRYRTAARLDQGLITSTPDWITARSAPVGWQPEADFHRYLAEGKQQAVLLLKQAVRGLEEEISARGDTVEMASNDVAPAGRRDLSKIFVVHGREEGPREAVARFLERLGFQPIILHEQAQSRPDGHRESRSS